jgi:H/ACA ribonucleoprotein complex subunit 3
LKGLLNRCPNCATYSMKGTCPKCGTQTVVAHPAKYSPDDKYARYRNPLAYKTETDTVEITE